MIGWFSTAGYRDFQVAALAYLMIMFPEGRERLRALGYYAAVSIGGGAVASPTEQADIERATAIHSAIAPQLRFPHMRQR